MKYITKLQEKAIDYLDTLDLSKVRGLKFFLQRIIRGWDDSDTWSLDTEIAKFALPRLRRWRKLGMHTTPNDILTAEEWNDILNEIEWLLDCAANFSYPADKEGNKRTERACRLFGKYFPALWD